MAIVRYSGPRGFRLREAGLALPCGRAKKKGHRRNGAPLAFFSIASVATIPAAATAAVPSAESAATARGAFLRLVDGQRAPAEVPAVQVTDGAIGLLRTTHLHEAEAPGAARVAIGHELHL